MSNQIPSESQQANVDQQTQGVGGNSIQVGGNYQSSTSMNLNLVVSVFFISILALGGIAWALNAGLIRQAGDANSTEAIQSKE